MQYVAISIIILLHTRIIFSARNQFPDYTEISEKQFDSMNYIAVFTFYDEPICVGTWLGSNALLTSCPCMKSATSRELLQKYSVKWGHFTYDKLNYTASISSVHKSCSDDAIGLVVVKISRKLENMIQLSMGPSKSFQEKMKVKECSVIFWSFFTNYHRIKIVQIFNYIDIDKEDVATLYGNKSHPACADIGGPIVCNNILIGVIQKRDNCYSGIRKDPFISVTTQKNWIQRKLDEKGCNKSVIFKDFWFFLLFLIILIFSCVY